MKHLIFILFFLFSTFVFANEGKIITDAEIFEKDSRTKIVTLKGNVNVFFQNQQLLCDSAKIYEKTNTIIAEGDIVLKTKESTITGKRLEFDYKTNKGKIFDGVITSGNVLLESELIEKIGDEEYVGKNAYYTTCITCPASWGFTAKKIRAKMGDFAYIYRPWLNILETPIPLLVPYLEVPLNSKRQTGFLFPKQAVSSVGGLGIEVPYFWAIDRSHDLTLSGLYYEKMGAQLTSQYRYVVDKGSFGEFSAGILSDRRIETPWVRWFFNYDHIYQLPESFVQRTQVRMVGDPRYPREFQQQSPYFGLPALDNRISLTKNMESAHLSVDASYYVSLTEKDIRTDNQTSIHRFPEINYISREMSLFQDAPFTFQFESQYLNIGRQGLSFDHLERGRGVCKPNQVCVDNAYTDRDGNPVFSGDFTYFDPTNNTGDLIRTGQRLDNSATFSAPFWIGSIFDVNPQLRLRHTQYALGVESDPSQGYDSMPSRSYVQMNLSARSFLSRIYDSYDSEDDVRYKHLLIPRIDYQIIPLYRQSQNRFFGTQDSLPVYREKQPLDASDIDIDQRGRGIQFDFRDRVYGRHLLTLGLLNKVYRKTVSDGQGQYTRALFFDISQSYDFKEAEQENSRPWQEINSLLAFQYRRFILHNQLTYFPYHAVSHVASTLQYSVNENAYLSLGYSLISSITEDPADRNNRNRTDSILFGSGFRSPWIDVSGNLEYSPKGNFNKSTGLHEATFRRVGVTATLKPPGECWLIHTTYNQLLDTEGQTNFNVSFEFTFGT